MVFLKICITVKDKNINNSIEKNFGRTPYIALYDTDTKEVCFVENTHCDASIGAGIRTARMVIDNGAEILYTGVVGENARRVIDSADIRIVEVTLKKSLCEILSELDAENLDISKSEI